MLLFCMLKPSKCSVICQTTDGLLVNTIHMDEMPNTGAPVDTPDNGMSEKEDGMVENEESKEEEQV